MLARLRTTNEVFAEGMFKSGIPYIRFSIAGDDAVYDGKFSTAFSPGGVAIPVEDFDYLASMGLIRNVQERHNIAVGYEVSRNGKYGTTDIIIPETPGSHVARRLAGLSIVGLDYPDGRAIIGNEILAKGPGHLTVHLNVDRKTVRIFSWGLE